MLKQGVSEENVERMTSMGSEKCLLIYPENNRFKAWWDLFMTLILLTTCILTPYSVSFSGLNVNNISSSIKFIEYSIDILFLLDIIIIFNTVIYDEDYVLVENRKDIANNYLRGWFFIDFLAILPLDFIMAASSKNVKMVRIARVGRLYKLVKLTRLLRILKLVK